jgi:hypothetical protein
MSPHVYKYASDFFENVRAMVALNSNPVAIGRGVHEELSRLHPQNDDDLADVLPDPFSLPRIKETPKPNSVLRKLTLWRSLLDALESLALMSIFGAGLILFARWVPLALSPV